MDDSYSVSVNMNLTDEEKTQTTAEYIDNIIEGRKRFGEAINKILNDDNGNFIDARSII